MPSPADRRARIATTAVFFVTGATMAAWATRVPAIQERLDLSAGALGLAILGLEAWGWRSGLRCTRRRSSPSQPLPASPGSPLPSA